MRVAEIFESIHGEVNGHHQGKIVTFIRLAGCNLYCPYCDTKEFISCISGHEMNISEIMEKVKELDHKYICITGGEPLLQKEELIELLNWLWWDDYRISIETNGTIDIAPFFRYVESFIVDYKINVPGWKPSMPSFTNLRKTDVIKFVVGSEEDVIQGIFGMEVLFNKSKIRSNPIMAFSPIISKNFGVKNLFDILIQEKVHNALISLQIHKLIDFK